MEADNVVVDNSTAYLVECAYSPQASEIPLLFDKVQKFEELAKTDPHFASCTKFVPVLAGKHWEPSVAKACV